MPRTSTNNPSGSLNGGGSGPAAAERMLPYDVRLKRELTHRRLVISMVRRLVRLSSLHLLDGSILVAVVLALAGAWPSAAGLRPLTPAVVVIFLLSLNAVSAYDPGDARRDRRRLLSGVVLAGLILACLVAFPPHLPLSPVVLLGLGGLGFLGLAAGRKLADLLVRQAYVHGLGLRRAVVIGNLDEVGRTIRELRDDRNIDQYIVGHVTRETEPDPAALGTLAQLQHLLDELDVEEVLVATTLPSTAMNLVTEWCFERGTAVFVVPPYLGLLDCRSEPLRVGACTLLHLHPARLRMPSLMLKRLFDLILAPVVLLLAAPIMAVIALAIRLDSPGPVLFRQQRVGLGGRRFTMWKFRCMVNNAEERKEELKHLNIYGDPRLFKMRDDPRITRVGRFLRRTSLDELPQLFNVFRGDMSLVGPRPPLPAEVERYEPHHFERLSVIPGITGPWQVSGRNLITDFDKVVQMERAYIRSWTLLLDAKILFRTIGVVIRGMGAY